MSLVVVGLFAAQVVATVPPLAPEEAARILAASPGLSNRTHAYVLPADAPRGPISASTGAPRAPAWPYPPSPSLDCCSIYVNGRGFQRWDDAQRWLRATQPPVTIVVAPARRAP